MRKIFTSLIALALLFCAVVFTQARPVVQSFESSVSVSNLERTAVAPSQSVSIIRESSAIIGTRNETLPCLAVSPNTKITQLKTETQKSVNHTFSRTVYDLPPNDAYIGLSFANLTRARPVIL